MPPISRGAAVFMLAYGSLALLLSLSFLGNSGGEALLETTSLIVGSILVLLGAYYMSFGRRYTLAGGLLVAAPLVPVVVLGLAWGAGDGELWMYVILSGLFLGFPPLVIGLYLLARSR